jgi:polysaccharide biosynthesis protein PslG
MRRFFVPLLALLLLIGGIWPPATSLYGLTGEEELAWQLRGIVHWIYTAVRPQPQLAPTTPLDHTAVTPFGMNTFLEGEALPTVREQSLALIAGAGFGAIRQQFVWEDIEIHGKDDFEDRRHEPYVDAWAKYDNIVDLSAQYEIEIIARLDNPPAWTRALTNTVGTYAPPDNLADYGDFVAAVVERYHGRITYFQLWNEPNIFPEWGEQMVNPEAFTELLCTGYRRAKAANPDAVILAPALAPTVDLSGRNLNNIVFLDRMYRAGAGDCFDIMAAQAYGLSFGATDQRLRPIFVNYPYHLFIRDVMVRHGDAGKPVWLTEMGWNTVPETLPAHYGRVSEAEQARYAVEAYRRAQQEWPWIGVINYWFFKRPGDSEKGQTWYYFRLLEPNFDPLPAFSALAEYATNPAAQPAAPRSHFFYGWGQLRPYLILLGGATLFFWLLGFLAPVTKPPDYSSP